MHFCEFGFPSFAQKKDGKCPCWTHLLHLFLFMLSYQKNISQLYRIGVTGRSLSPRQTTRLETQDGPHTTRAAHVAVVVHIAGRAHAAHERARTIEAARRHGPVKIPCI